MEGLKEWVRRVRRRSAGAFVVCCVYAAAEWQGRLASRISILTMAFVNAPRPARGAWASSGRNANDLPQTTPGLSHRSRPSG
jgi:hypothetical protein